MDVEKSNVCQKEEQQEIEAQSSTIVIVASTFPGKKSFRTNAQRMTMTIKNKLCCQQLYHRKKVQKEKAAAGLVMELEIRALV
jgi:hypothetical protein